MEVELPKDFNLAKYLTDDFEIDANSFSNFLLSSFYISYKGFVE